MLKDEEAVLVLGVHRVELVVILTGLVDSETGTISSSNHNPRKDNIIIYRLICTDKRDDELLSLL